MTARELLDTLTTVAGILSPFLVVAGIVIAKRFDRGTQREMYPVQVIADLRLQISKLEEKVAAADKKAETAEQKAEDARREAREEVERVRHRERALDDYIEELRAAWGSPPPPPAWPPGLRSA